jgi:hypothetical protein
VLRDSPRRANAVVSFAPSAAKRMSHMSAITRPSPAAGPLIAAITGFGIVSGNVWGRSSAAEPSPEPGDCRISISAPAQKPRPAPVTTIALTPGSAAASSSRSK